MGGSVIKKIIWSVDWLTDEGWTTCFLFIFQNMFVSCNFLYFNWTLLLFKSVYSLFSTNEYSLAPIDTLMLIYLKEMGKYISDINFLTVSLSFSDQRRSFSYIFMTCKLMFKSKNVWFYTKTMHMMTIFGMSSLMKRGVFQRKSWTKRYTLDVEVYKARHKCTQLLTQR